MFLSALNIQTPAPSSQNRQKEKYRYDAFLSYAHEDRATVEWLRKLLANYWVPWKRRRKIFMDHQSLSADGGLSEKLKDALQNSRFLIVCCSKSAADSHWVNLEINEFLKSHPRQNVLACLVGNKVDEAIFLPQPICDLDKNLNDPLFKPDLREQPENLKRWAKKEATKTVLSLLAPLANLPSKDALLDKQKKFLILTAIIVISIFASTIGWKLWDDRPASQVDKVIKNSTSLIYNASSLGYEIEDYMRTLILVGRLDEGRIAADRLKNNYTQEGMQKILAIAYTKAGLFDQASALAISDEAKAIISVALAKAGHFDKAFVLANSIDALSRIDNEKASLYEIKWREMVRVQITKYLAASGQLERAGKIYLATLNKNYSEEGFLMALCFDSDNLIPEIEYREKIGNHLLAEVKKIDDKEARDWLSGLVAIFLVSTRQFERIKEIPSDRLQAITPELTSLFKEFPAPMQSSGIPAVMLAGLSVALAETGQDELAKHTANEALLLTNKIVAAPLPHAKALGKTAIAFTKTGQPQKAKEAARKLLKILEKAKREDSEEVISNIIFSLVEADQLENAKELINMANGDFQYSSIKFPRFLARAFAELIKLNKREKDISFALGVMKGRSIKDLGILTEEFVESKQPEEARRTANEALAMANSIMQSSTENAFGATRSMALGNAAKSLAMAGEIEKAKEVIGEALQHITRLDSYERAHVYLAAAEVFAELHDYKTAREMAESCNDLSSQIKAYTAIIREYAIQAKGIDRELFDDDL